MFNKKLPIFSMLTLLIGIGVTNTAAAYSVLIVAADASTPKQELEATGKFSSVDEFYTWGATPTLAQLQSYDAVLAYTILPPADPTGLGNVLQQFVNSGGGLVINTYAFSSPFAIGGAITANGSSPLVNSGTNGDVSGSLVPVVPNHPIFTGVDVAALTYYHDASFAHPSLDAGATLLATDGAGHNLIAINAVGNIIANNLYPGFADENNANFYALIANELLYTANAVQPVPEPSTSALLGIGLAGIWLRRRASKESSAV